MSDSSPNLPVVHPQDNQLNVVRPGLSLIARIVRESCQSPTIKTNKTRTISRSDIDEQSYHQIRIWLREIESANRSVLIEDFVKKQESEVCWICPADWVVNGKIVHVNLANYEMGELDLSCVPNLTALWCGRNRLSELDLNNILHLSYLSCYRNQLTRLDLSRVPNLTELWCDTNGLTELDLVHVPKLAQLGCGLNSLTTLNLSHVPALTKLWCYNYDLAELDVRRCATTEFALPSDPQVITHKRPDQIVVQCA